MHQGYNLVFAGNIGYAFSMFVLYMFCYSEVEMTSLASYSRYMGSFVTSEYLILLFIFCRLTAQISSSSLNTKSVLIVFGSSLFLLDATRLVDLAPQVLKGEPMIECRIRAEYIQNHTEDEDDIFVISSNNCAYIYYLNYYLENRDMDIRYLYSNIASESESDSEYWQSIKDCIEENNYVYICDGSEQVNFELGRYSKSSTLEDNTLYKVVLSNTGLRLNIVK